MKDPAQRYSKHYKPKRRSSPHRTSRRQRSRQPVRMKPESDPSLRTVFARIGKPAAAPFTPDRFQTEALAAITQSDCLVTAPTGAGKTWIAEQAIAEVFARGGRSWYASPLKALTNSKWVEFGDTFHTRNVGILTGDTKENADAPIIVGTTEILRNQLYDAMHRVADLNYDLVILDEAHFLGDPERGVVWEEIMIYLPHRINLLLLSATIGNAREIADWLQSLRKKRCTVIAEHKRPVPLYPLFLHPSGRILPLMEGKRLHKKVTSYLENTAEKKPQRNRLAPFGEIIRVLRQYHLLPALFFLKSRSECDAALAMVPPSGGSDSRDAFNTTLDTLTARFPYITDHKQMDHLHYHRVGAHHGGQLPAWKFVVESMMKEGHLDAVFATTTIAAGVNFPARTVVLFNSDQFNGHSFMPLTATEFHQMTGRAGRRGKDRIGFMLAFPDRFMDVEHLRDLFLAGPDSIESRIRSDFSMVLNLLLSHTPEEIRDVFLSSFAEFQRGKKDTKGRKRLWDSFLHHLGILKEEGFVDNENRLTEDGVWTSQLRLDQPLLIAECLRNDAFPHDTDLLAAVVALFVYDRGHDVHIPRKKVPKRLRRACEQVITVISPLAARLEAEGFEIPPLPLWASVAIYQWVRQFDWDDITDRLHLADGDLAMLISRTADNLQQIASLKDTYPDIARAAVTGRHRLLREPVVFEQEPLTEDEDME